ncbi:MAG: hypothetical protein NVS3B25_34750 [Hymenobacter sp.]
MEPAYALTLAAVRRTCQRLWNDVLISADEKRKASAYYQQHQDDIGKLYALNKRMGDLISARTPRHQKAA